MGAVPVVPECPTDVLEQQKQTITVLNSKLQDRDAQLAEAKNRYQAEIGQVKQQLTDSQKQVASLQERLRGMTDTQKQRDQTIVELRAQLRERDAQLEEKQR